MIRVFTSLLEIIRYGFESVVVPECTHELPIKTVQDCTELSQLLVAGKKVIDFHRPFANANRKAYRKLVGVQVFILFLSCFFLLIVRSDERGKTRKKGCKLFYSNPDVRRVVVYPRSSLPRESDAPSPPPPPPVDIAYCTESRQLRRGRPHHVVD